MRKNPVLQHSTIILLFIQLMEVDSHGITFDLVVENGMVFVIVIGECDGASFEEEVAIGLAGW